MASLFIYLIIAITLMVVGLYGLSAKRNLMRLFFSTEILMNAGNLVIIAFSRYGFWDLMGSSLSGQAIALFFIALEAAEAAIALAVILVVSRVHGNVDIRELNELEG